MSELIAAISTTSLIYFAACWLFPRSIWKKEHLL